VGAVGKLTGFSVPEMIKIGSFLTELFKKIKMRAFFGTQCSLVFTHHCTSAVIIIIIIMIIIINDHQWCFCAPLT